MNRSAALHTIIGAMAPAGTNWNLLNYRDEGDRVYVQYGDGKPAVVRIIKNGPGLIEKFDTSSEASDAYDALVANPGELWWIGLYDATIAQAGEQSLRDSTYLGGVNETTNTTTTVTKKTLHIPLAPIAVGFGLFLTALIGFGRSKH